MWSKGYGNVDPFNMSSPVPTIDNLYVNSKFPSSNFLISVRIASITKVFTSAMLYYMRDVNMVSLDDPITKYMPDFSVKNPFATSGVITLRNLASHTSGLQREVINTKKQSHSKF